MPFTIHASRGKNGTRYVVNAPSFGWVNSCKVYLIAGLLLMLPTMLFNVKACRPKSGMFLMLARYE